MSMGPRIPAVFADGSTMTSTGHIYITKDNRKSAPSIISLSCELPCCFHKVLRVRREKYSTPFQVLMLEHVNMGGGVIRQNGHLYI